STLGAAAAASAPRRARSAPARVTCLPTGAPATSRPADAPARPPDTGVRSAPPHSTPARSAAPTAAAMQHLLLPTARALPPPPRSDRAPAPPARAVRPQHPAPSLARFGSVATHLHLLGCTFVDRILAMRTGVVQAQMGAAPPVDGDPLQECLSLAWHAMLLRFVATLVVAEAFLIGQKRLPADVGGIDILETHGPLLQWQTHFTTARVSRCVAGGVIGVTTIHIGAGIGGIVQDRANATRLRTP